MTDRKNITADEARAQLRVPTCPAQGVTSGGCGMSAQKYRGVRVTKHNVALDTYKVSFDHCGMRFYDIFRNKETADFWAGKLKSGEWDPLKDSPTNALRDQLEVVG